MNHQVATIRVSAKTKSNKVAGDIAGAIRDQGVVEIQTIGAGALNQAIKGIAIARGFLAPSGINIVFTPAFHDVYINRHERTAIKLRITSR